MSTILLLGAGLGLGLFMLARGARRRVVPIDELVKRLDRAPSVTSGSRSNLLDALRRSVEGRSTAAVHRDVRVTGRGPDRHAVEKLAGAVGGAGAPVLLHVLLLVQGGGLAPALLVVAVVGASVIGFVWPDVRLRRAARQRRLQFTHALSSYLDLVNVVLAGGAGIESALEAAADAGDGWAFEEVRDALVRARSTRRSPWLALGELGDELGIEPLSELAASVQLAGEQGARIRSSLTAKAAAMRARQSMQLEADAHAASERMGVPTVLMFVGFLILLGFPALQQIAGPAPATTSTPTITPTITPTHMEAASTWTPTP
jgi:tight adherence protein C